MAFDFDVKVTGAEEVAARLRLLPKNARDEARKELTKLSRGLANKIRAAGRAATKPRGTGGGAVGAAANTVRARTGLTAGVLAGPHPLLFGSEFGANGRYGWYSAERYKDSVGRQFHPRGGSNWFFKTVDQEQAEFDAAAQAIADDIVRDWGA